MSLVCFVFVLVGYGLFGVGYIGYMMFIVVLLCGVGMSGMVVVVFYVMFGIVIVVLVWLWLGLFDWMCGG